MKLIKGSRMANLGRKLVYVIVAQLYVVDKQGEDHELIPPNIEAILENFSDIFEEPHGLPPPSCHDHYIPLKA